jgi:LysR family nitrogen assimilation transcriptional regulator
MSDGRGPANLRHWRHFVRVAELGSLSRAAERLGVAQPVLSRELRALEKTLGTPLLRRHGRGVSLTPSGELFRRRAETILSQIAGVSDEITASNTEPTGNLSIGVPPSLGSVLTAPLIAAYHERFSAVKLHVSEATSIQTRDALLAGEIEIGILSMPLAEPALTIRPLVNEPMVLVGPSRAPLDPKRPVPLADLAAVPLVLSKRPNSTRIIIEHALEGIGLSANVPVETDTAPIGEFIRRGIGYAVLPGCMVLNSGFSGLRFAPVADLSVTWMTAYPKGAALSLSAVKMLEMIEVLVLQAIKSGRWKARFLRDPSRSEVAGERKARRPRRDR